MLQVTLMGFIIMYKGHVKYNHFQISQSQALYWMIIEIKNALNYHINCVCVCLLWFDSQYITTLDIST